MKSNKVITANGVESIKLKGHTAAQQTQINGHMDRWNKNEQRIADTFGVESGWNPQAFAGNAATVPHDAWGQWAAEGIALRRSMLGIFDDLSSALSRSVDIGVLVDYYAKYSDNSSDVNVSIDGRGKAKTDQNTVDYEGTPIYIIDNNVSFGWRQMATMMRAQGGVAMRDNAMRNKNRHILEKLEDMVLNGLPGNIGGAQSYGLLNHPDRNTFAHGIDIIGATAKEIKDAVVGTLKAAHADNYKSGFTLYMNWDDYFYAQTYQDAMSGAEGVPTATGAMRRTIEQELLNIPGLDRIVATDSVPTNTLIAFVRDRECGEMLDAMGLTQRAKFRANPEDDYVFTNMVAQSLQLKSDFKKQMGLSVGTKS